MDEPDGGWLITNQELPHMRAPGYTCLTALRSTQHGEPHGRINRRLNDSKGNGGAMRVAPVAIWPGNVAEVFRIGVDTAAITHGHPTGFLSAGTLA